MVFFGSYCFLAFDEVGSNCRITKGMAGGDFKQLPCHQRLDPTELVDQGLLVPLKLMAQ